MKYFCIDHFFEESEAYILFDNLTKAYDLKEGTKEGFWRYASKEEYWIALEKSSNDTTGIDTIITLIADLQAIPKDLFTIVEYEYIKVPKGTPFEVQKILPNRFRLRFKKQEENKYYEEYVSKIIDFSKFTFIIKTFFERYGEAFEEIIKLDKEISAKYKWRVQKDFRDDFLSELETFLELCGRNYSKAELNYNLAKTHIENIKKINLKIDISQIYTTIDEMRFKLTTSKIIYERIKDMKDLTLGNIELRNTKSNLQTQEKLIELQNYAITINEASKIIEIFIIYAYTFVIWKTINEAGFKHITNIFVMFLTPLLIAIGVVLLVEVLKDLKTGFKKNSILYFIFSIILLSYGIYLITRIPQ